MPIARPGVCGMFVPLVAFSVEPDVGPEIASFHPLVLREGISMLVGLPLCTSSCFSATSCVR